MIWTPPNGHHSAADLDFSQATEIRKNPLGEIGFPMRIGRNHGNDTVLSLPARQYTSGSNNDKTARWRKGRGLSHGQINMKAIKGKTGGRP
jgi:hypothetical protein